MPETPAEIEDLLKQTQAADPIVREFAWIWLETYRRDTQDIVDRLRREGRALARRGEDPDPIRQQTEERLEEARQRLRDRLARLLVWAKDSGR